MPRPADRDGGVKPPPRPVIVVPEIRDYQRINAELVGLLDAGHRHVRLDGVEGQRLLVSGLSGGWEAVVEVAGPPGPECAAFLDAPGLTVVCHGRAADGAALGLRNGRVLFRSGVGVGVGYAQSGGLIVVSGPAGARAGLNQRGGTLVALGPVGRLAGERQQGGRAFAAARHLGPHPARGRWGDGRWLELPRQAGWTADDEAAWLDAADLVRAWGDPALLPG